MKCEDRFRFCSLFIVGSVLIFTFSCRKEKPGTLPELSTEPLTNITSTSLVSGGNITSDGGFVVLSRGICWGTDFNPTIYNNITTDGEGTGSFISDATGMVSGTEYYVRSYATNSLGTAYGNAIIFITPLTDIDGNVYSTVAIGNQVWMSENLKTSRYSDNTKIPHITDNTEWSNLSTPGYCLYGNNDVANVYKNGAIYNWYAVNTGKLCPEGWHVPDEDEWTTLTDYLGGESDAGGKLKEVGTNHWTTPNSGATNDFGFTALPSGYRTGLTAGSFRASSYIGWWWASTESDLIWPNIESSELIWARNRTISFDVSEIAKGLGLKRNGYSVRCVKDDGQTRKRDILIEQEVNLPKNGVIISDFYRIP
jgi:uncharacterized protein (TIGR02145 family)